MVLMSSNPSSQGSHYSRARAAHSMIYEVLMSMMLEGFLFKFHEKRMQLETLQFDFQSKELSSEEWKSKNDSVAQYKPGPALAHLRP